MRSQSEEISPLTKLRIMQIIGHLISIIGGIIIFLSLSAQIPLLEEQGKIIKRLEKIMSLCSQNYPS